MMHRLGRGRPAALTAWQEPVTADGPAERLFTDDGPPQPPARPLDMADDPVHDAIALVQAIREDDVRGVAVVVTHGAHPGISIVLGRVLACMADAHGMCPACLRSYVHEAMSARER